MPFLGMMLIRTLRNAWCTSHTMGSDVMPCMFGGAGCGQDRLSHYLRCHAASECVFAASRLEWGGAGARGVLRSLLLCEALTWVSLAVAMAQDLVYTTANALRVTGAPPEAASGIMYARVRELRRAHEGLGGMVTRA